MSFTPTNPLEEALVDFWAGKLTSEEILRVFLESKIYVPSGRAVERDWEEFVPLIFPRDELFMVACFSSPDRARKYADSFEYLLTVDAFTFLTVLKVDAGVVLNPGYTVGLELFAPVIAEIVARARKVPRHTH